ncbi:MAG: DNA recombination protein RmuC [Acidobacteria bacterium]|nr:DNA recombination protein RmuC [Acidobacteriota bacterium]
MENLFLLVAGAALGGFAAWLAANAKCKGILSEVRAQITGLQSALESREREVAQLQERLSRESQERVKAQTELDQARVRLDEERTLLANAEKSLADAFDALADRALKSNNQAFLELARSTFETVQAQAKGDLDTRQKAIDGLVGPLKDSLGRYEKQIQEIEKSRQGAYTSLSDQIIALQKVTGSLDVALRTPQVRGRWGEMTLRRVAELAGMSAFCDFTEQETLTSGSIRQRPDMIVNLPGGRRIAVDAKAPLQAFLDAASASTPEERQACMVRHGQHVRAHMTQLGMRSYWEQFDQAPDFVVLFLPGEAFFGAALEHDRTLIEDGIERGVILATPTTLIALLRAVAYGWRQEQATRQAQKISEIGNELYERVKRFLDRFEAVGTALRRAVDNYNQAAGSLESRLLPSARKLHEMGAVPGEEIPDIDMIDELPRALAVPERAGPD